MGLSTFIVGPIEEYDTSLPRILAENITKKTDDVLNHQVQDRYEVENVFSQLARKHNVHYISILDALCPEKKCKAVNADGVPVQFDYGHLTKEGSLLLFETLLNEKKLSFVKFA